MIPVYICDDELIWLKKIAEFMDYFIIQDDRNEIEICYSATTPQDLLEHLAAHLVQNAVYFLDVDLKDEINGIELALKIREKDPRGFIIFVTTYAEMAIKTFEYKVEALDYIVKDKGNLQSQISHCLNRVQHVLFHNQTLIPDTILIHCAKSEVISYNGSNISTIIKSDIAIPIDDILFIETIKNSRKLNIHKKDALLETSSTIAEMQSKLGDNFVLCDKSCLVNLLHVREILRIERKLIMDNDESCFCSFRQLPKICRRFQALHKLA